MQIGLRFQNDIKKAQLITDGFDQLANDIGTK